VSPVPVLSGRDVVGIFSRLGWGVARQRGSHVIMVKPGHAATLSVPDHREVARGTLRTLIRRAGLTIEAFLAAARQETGGR
jgi:predicted RNA binding protein YcfA (HicA-like mRNA interferase family)